MDTWIQLALLAAVALCVISAAVGFHKGEARRAGARGATAVGSVGEALRRVPFGGKVVIVHLPANDEGSAAEVSTQEDPKLAAALCAPQVRHVLLRASTDAEVAAHVFAKYAKQDPAGISVAVLNHKGETLGVGHAEGRPLTACVLELLA